MSLKCAPPLSAVTSKWCLDIHASIIIIQQYNINYFLNGPLQNEYFYVSHFNYVLMLTLLYSWQNIPTLPNTEADTFLFSQWEDSSWIEITNSQNWLLLHNSGGFLCQGICASYPWNNTSKCMYICSMCMRVYNSDEIKSPVLNLKRLFVYTVF